jgi:putative oxidoreductase
MTRSTAISDVSTDTWTEASGKTRREWLNRLLGTERDPAATVSRLVLGGVLLPHGAQHLLGWFGGYGFAGTYAWMTGSLGIPGPIAAFGIVFEVVGPLMLLLGLGGRAVAAGLAMFMTVAASTHVANGFFMNWVGKQAGEGYEYHLLAIALAAVVVLRGSGALSIDRLIMGRLEVSRSK